MPSPRLSADEIAVITPTKGRHPQLRMLLQTLSAQTMRPGKVLIADGGGDAEAVVAEFAGQLDAAWFDCPVAGQIPQRNFALAQLPQNIRAVIYFDDDIQLHPDAIARIVEFWNAQPMAPGGVAFNLGNLPAQPDSPMRRIFGMGTRPPGRILRSGYNTPIVDLEQDLMDSQWLFGGATLWRRDVLERYRLPDLPSDWATCEDIIFSYPVSKVEALHVCAAARADHVDEPRVLDRAAGRRRGRAAVLWRAWFVSRNADLSKTAFLWMNLGMVLGWAARGLRGNPVAFGYVHGTAQGMGIALRHWLTGRDIADALR